MNETIYSSELLRQKIRAVRHPSGLTVLLCPMPEFATACAMFAAGVGSTDLAFRSPGEKEFTEVPAGVAHFLEHKMFECEDGDAFEKYAATGANANAFTGYDRTTYLFTCTQNFEASLKILLDFVTRPYFTPETVKKEQGIIAQEIKMYEDAPDWRVLQNLLGALYVRNPVREDIAGTVESIGRIDDRTLYRCYGAFYNLHNMALAVAGNFDPDRVLALCDAALKPAPDAAAERRPSWEPRGVGKTLAVQKLPVSVPMFELGFKAEAGTPLQNLHNSILDELLLDLIAGESTDLYRRLYDGGLINGAFDSDTLPGRDYLCCSFGGESRSPEAVRDALYARIGELREKGIPEEDFLRAKRSAYGRYIGLYCRAESVAGLMASAHLAGEDDIYAPLERVRSAALPELEDRLRRDFDPAYSALSIIEPSESEAKE